MTDRLEELEAQLSTLRELYEKQCKMLWLLLANQERIITDHELANLDVSAFVIEQVRLDDDSGFIIRRARAALEERE